MIAKSTPAPPAGHKKDAPGKPEGVWCGPLESWPFLAVAGEIGNHSQSLWLHNYHKVRSA
jgi:hypothetical protein